MSCWGSNDYGQVMFVVYLGLGCCVMLVDFTRGLCFVLVGEILFVLTTCIFVQLGDDSTMQRSAPVGVVGLSSGIVMIALAGVRLVINSLQLLFV